IAVEVETLFTQPLDYQRERVDGLAFPPLASVAKDADNINFLIPNGRQVDAHRLEFDADEDDCAASARPAQAISQCAAGADGVVDKVEAADEVLNAQIAAEVLRSRQPCYARVALACENDFVRAFLLRQFS